MIESYLESKKHAWSPTTMRSEKYRLRKVAKYVDKDPLDTYNILKHVFGEYTLKSVFIRLSEYEKFVLETVNYRRFMEQYANLFKNVYRQKQVPLSYDEAESRIIGIRDNEVKTAALYMLRHGLRHCELTNIHDGYVKGKGRKLRPIFVLGPKSEGSCPAVSYSRLYRSLRSIGLTPHTLRKLFITKLAEKMNVTDIAYIVGHSNIQTTMGYIQPKKNEELSKQIEEALNGK